LRVESGYDSKGLPLGEPETMKPHNLEHRYPGTANLKR